MLNESGYWAIANLHFDDMAPIFQNGGQRLLAQNALPTLQLLFYVFSTTNII